MKEEVWWVQEALVREIIEWHQYIEHVSTSFAKLHAQTHVVLIMYEITELNDKNTVYFQPAAWTENEFIRIGMIYILVSFEFLLDLPLQPEEFHYG